MTTTRTASQQITAEVTSWPDVTAGPGRRGEFAFKVGRREIGHLHGDHAAHFSFPKELWAQLREQGRIVEHPVFPGKVGPAARSIDSDADTREVIALMRLNYERLTVRQPAPGVLEAVASVAGEQYCYLTTRGRVSGRPHRIEIWFALDGTTLYLLSGGRERSDWVRNLRQTPAATVEIGAGRFSGRARIVSDHGEDERARALVYDKYAGSYEGDLTSWRDSALPIAVELEHREPADRN